MRERHFRFIDADGHLQDAGYRSRVRLVDGTVGVVASFTNRGNSHALDRLVLVKEDGTTLVVNAAANCVAEVLNFYVPRVAPGQRAFEAKQKRYASGGYTPFYRNNEPILDKSWT